MNFKKVLTPIRNSKNEHLSLFVDKEPDRENKLYISEFGDSSHIKQKVENEKPLMGDSVKADIKKRPDEPDHSEYETTPISSFGVGLLMRMGWVEGQPIGLTNKGLSQPIEFIPRPHGLGLGAESYIVRTGMFAITREFTSAHLRRVYQSSKILAGPKVKINRGKYGGLFATLVSLDSKQITGKIRIHKTNEVQLTISHIDCYFKSKGLQCY
ncbi:hypothetical protein MXB_1240 [Myxobolus squamalis]|nr:hypothetical protein MXB_1240 [Myxobolus squamalis]